MAAYTMLRNDVLKQNKFIEVKEEEENVNLILAFNDPNIDNETFEKMLSTENKADKAFSKLKRRISQISA